MCSNEESCGVNSQFTCEIINEEIVQTCVCFDSFSRSAEFALYVDDFREIDLTDETFDPSLVRDEKPFLDVFQCSSNDGIQTGLYSAVAVSCVIVIVFHLGFIRKYRHFRRLLPLLIGFSLHFSYSVIRIIDPTRRFGVDIAFTLLWALGYFFTNVMSLVFFNKYVAFHKKNIGGEALRLRKTMIRVNKIQYVIVTFDFIGSIFLALSVFVNDSKTVLVLVRFAFFIGFARSLYSFVGGYYLVQKLIDSISGLNSTAMQTKQHNRYKDTIVNLKRVKFAVLFTNFLYIIFFILPVVSDTGLRAWMYILPVYILVGASMTMVVLLSYQRQKMTINLSKIKDQATALAGKTQQIIRKFSNINQKPDLKEKDLESL